MDLLDNPFYVLGATARDRRDRLIALADERSLTLDPEQCTRARSELAHPRKRLSAEVAWLPGVGPRRISELIGLIGRRPQSVADVTGLMPLSLVNLLAAATLRMGPETTPEALAERLTTLATTFDAINAEEVLSVINEEREVAGFPLVTDLAAVDEELKSRRRHLCAAMKAALDVQPSAHLVAAVTLAVSEATEGGDEQAPVVIDDLIDSYQVDAAEFLEREAENVGEIVGWILQAVKAGDGKHKLDVLISQLESTVKNWDRVAQPIQISARSRGLEHAPSNALAGRIRALSLDLWNEHSDLERARRVTALLQDVFNEVPEIDEQLSEDAEALENIKEKRDAAERKRAAWAKEIAFSTTVGRVFKKPLRLSQHGIEWDGRHWPLDSIIGVRWGGTRNSVNGIPTGTTYTVQFKDEATVGTVTLTDEATYDAFVDRLWKAVGRRLFQEFLEHLAWGEKFQFGEVWVMDNGVVLQKWRPFRASEPVQCDWSELKVWSDNGSFCLGCEHRSVEAALPYQGVWNVHLLELAVRALFKNGGTTLSSIRN